MQEGTNIIFLCFSKVILISIAELCLNDPVGLSDIVGFSAYTYFQLMQLPGPYLAL